MARRRRGSPEGCRPRRVHRSHRAALVRKAPAHYGPLFPDADPAEPYFRPGPGAGLAERA